ncbi:MAG: uroporphyrinogen decarboxylase family protein [Victivallaceae bacterium]|nr:uroporphyrinogen decarboxylase family protein [Victivallaceae bacterium]
MTKREIVRAVFEFNTPPYVPWEIGFTQEAAEKLKQHYGVEELTAVLDNHYLWLGNASGVKQHIGNERYQDRFGVIWNCSVDKDIGVIEGQILPEANMKGYQPPPQFTTEDHQYIEKSINNSPDLFRGFPIGFSLYERAWTLRGMEPLMMDFIEHPDFVHELLTTITDYNISQVKEALKHDIDCVHFGDDWGQQCGLQMGPQLWREFIYPQLKRVYKVVKDAGKYVSIHSCGDVDELFDDLINIGLNCFNPFQPEVMDVNALMKQHQGKLAFHGGLSTQKTLPYGTVDEVVAETEHLLSMGRNGGYIFAPAHAVEGDVPIENMVAFIDTVQAQKR